MGEKVIHAIIIIGIIAILVMIGGIDKSPSTINLGPSDLRNRITVSGNSEVTAEPDEAILYIKIETKGSTAKEAQDANSERSNAVTKALSGKIETDRYNIWENKYWNPKKNREESQGYRVQHVLKVTTSNVKGVGEILDKAVKAGANGVERIQFTLSKQKQMKVNADALKKASELAEEKANSIADSLDVSLGDIIRISESNYFFTPSDYYPRAELAVSEDSIAPEISPQNVNVRANINIEYEIK